MGETYFRYESPESGADSKDALGDVGRVGSLSLVVFSCITFLSSVLLPFCVQPPDTQKPAFTSRPPPGLAQLLKKITTVRPDLQKAWLLSHLVFAATMIFAPLARSRAFATLLVAICGIPWAVSGWAPFAFMGVEINRLGMGPSAAARSSGVTMITSASYQSGAYRPAHERDASAELDVLRVNHDEEYDTDEEEGGGGGSSVASTGELAGIYLGVLNVYTTIPQFVGTFISWIVFSIFEPGGIMDEQQQQQQQPETKSRAIKWMKADKDAPNAIAICLFIGAISALVAAEATRRLRFVGSGRV